MNDEPSNIVIEHLKALRAEVAAVKADTQEMRMRMGQVETGIAGLRRDFAHADENAAILSVRIDRLIERMDRLEKRLEVA
jgi:chromosome segregation ATPase